MSSFGVRALLLLVCLFFSHPGQTQIRNLWDDFSGLDVTGFSTNQLHFQKFLNSDSNQLPGGHFFRIKQMQNFSGIDAIRAQHYFEGIAVRGSQSIAWYQNQRPILYFDHVTRHIVASPNPNLFLEEAMDIAMEEIKSWYPGVVPGFPVSGSLSFYDEDTLAYGIEIITNQLSSLRVWVDAHTGSFVDSEITGGQINQEIWNADSYDLVSFLISIEQKCRKIRCNSQTVRQLYQTELTPNLKKELLIGQGQTLANIPFGSANMNTIGSAYQNTEKFLKYIKSKFSRNSYDNKGSAVVSSINVKGGLDNAAWLAPLQMAVYVEGNAKKYKNMVEAEDIVAHELTHGVITNSSGLGGVSEAGALNESFADYFGELVEDKNNWKMGESIFIFGTNYIRDMAFPSSKGHPEKYSQRVQVGARCTRSNDFCGVHKNAGIPNKAAFLFTDAVGKDFAALVYYQVMTAGLVPRSDFSDAANKIYAACKLMDPNNGTNPCQEVINAWKAVEIPINVRFGTTLPTDLRLN